MAKVSTLVGLMASFDPALTSRTAASRAVLLRGAVLSTRERAVTACLVAAWPWVRKGRQAYENVLRRAQFCMLVIRQPEPADWERAVVQWTGRRARRCGSAAAPSSGIRRPKG